MPHSFLSLSKLLLLPLLLLPVLAVGVLADSAVDVQARSVTLAMASEPPTLNSLVSTNNVSAFVFGHVMEGLTQYGPNGDIIPGVAERWELREDGATFWLRRDARWSDGKPVTAHDFVFAWRQVVKPSTGSQYAFIMYPVRHAAAINKGQLPATDLAVQAVGDYQLKVEFEQPCPYFIGLTAFMVFLPVREDFYQRRGERYAADKEDLLYNGAFVLSKWVHDAHLRFDKNPHYWNADDVQLDVIDIPYMIPDASATFNLFQNGNIALANLDIQTLKPALDRGYPLFQYHTGAQYFLEFNHREGQPTVNLWLRKAIQAVFDPAELTNKILAKPGFLVGESLFPVIVKGVHGRFRDEYPPPVVEHNLRVARDYLARAKQALGGDIRPLVLLSGDSPRAAQEAEYLQNILQQGLGITVRIDAQTFKQYLEKMTRGDFDIVIAGWGPDYDDGLTFADRLASWNDNNRGMFHNAEYDQQVQIMARSLVPEERVAAMARLQEIIVAQAAIIPTFERGEIYVQSPQLKGVVRLPFGADPNLRFARVIDVDAPVIDQTSEEASH